MKIYITAAIHGDELFGLKVIGRIRQTGNNKIVVKIGHPEAIAKKKKFLEEDLNRCFTGEKKCIENQIANDIKKEITKYKADLIIDIHTSIVSVGKVAIVAEHSPLTNYVAKNLGMDFLVIMPRNLTEKSLIGCFPNKSISIEMGKSHRSDKLALEIAKKIESLELSEFNGVVDLPIFEVYGQIDKDYKNLKGIKNLVYNEKLGGYPFLAGENTYASIGGFLMRKIK